MTAKAPTPMPDNIKRPKAPSAPPKLMTEQDYQSQIKETERINLINENLLLHEEVRKAREEVKKLQRVVQRLGNKLSKLEKEEDNETPNY